MKRIEEECESTATEIMVSEDEADENDTCGNKRL